MSRIDKPLTGEPLADLVDASSAVGATRSRLAKVERIAEVLRRLGPSEVAAGVAFLSGELRQRQIGVGWAALRDLPAPAHEPSLRVGDVDAAFERIGTLSGPGSQAARREAVAALFVRATEAEARFLVRLLGGELRQGALEGVMVQALALAAGAKPAEVQRAFMLRGDLAAVAEAVLQDGPAALDRFRLEVGRPVRPMLARPAKDVAEAMERLGEAAVEWKLDGARVQIHRRDAEVGVFTRTLDDVTARVPEIVAAALALPVRTVVLDGEAIALRPDSRPEPFQVTGSRFARERQREVPLSLFVFDVLHADGEDVLDLSGAERAAVLAALVPESHRTPRVVVSDAGSAGEFLQDAIARGHEGVMLKALDQPYAAGSRGTGWLKVKPVHTLDLVVLAAEWGHGRRRGWLSNLHLGARDPGGGGFVMLGKTFKGLTDAMLTWQTEKLLELETSRDNYTVHVRPELVVEIAFDGVQTSPRYPGGVALRFARVLRHRPDKPAAEADTLEGVLAAQAGTA
jgi:DNA ligase 1